jgi:hypothetical protein
MILVRLTPDLRMAVVAAPSYFAQRSVPRSPAELDGHACLIYRWYDAGALHPWRFNGPEEPFEVLVDSVMTANDTSLLLDAAVRSCGVALPVKSLVETHIAQGSLQRVLDTWCKPFPGLPPVLSEPSLHADRNAGFDRQPETVVAGHSRPVMATQFPVVSGAAVRRVRQERRILVAPRWKLAGQGCRSQAAGECRLLIEAEILSGPSILLTNVQSSRAEPG